MWMQVPAQARKEDIGSPVSGHVGAGSCPILCKSGVSFSGMSLKTSLYIYLFLTDSFVALPLPAPMLQMSPECLCRTLTLSSRPPDLKEAARKEPKR